MESICGLERTLIAYSPNPGHMVYGSRTSTGTILTIPANSVWCGDVAITASVAVAATGSPTVTVSGTAVEPSAGTTLNRLSITGLALTTVSDSNTISAIVMTGDNPATLEFNTGGATSAAVVCNGFTL